MLFTLRLTLGILLVILPIVLASENETQIASNLTENKQNSVVSKVQKSIDIDKYVSKDFHDKNNPYIIPNDENEQKFAVADFEFSSTTHFSFNSDLTTPKSVIFDEKYAAAVESVDQTLDHLDASAEITDSESKEVNLDTLYQESVKNGTTADLDYVKFKNIIKNDSIAKTSKHKDVIVEDGSNLNFKSSFNKTDIFDDDDNNTISKEETSTLSNLILNQDQDNAESTNSKIVLTTPKTLILTKPPNVKNDTAILSNKIETGKSKGEPEKTIEIYNDKQPIHIVKRMRVKQDPEILQNRIVSKVPEDLTSMIQEILNISTTTTESARKFTVPILTTESEVYSTNTEIANTGIVNSTTENGLTTTAKSGIVNSTTENVLTTTANTGIFNSTTENVLTTTANSRNVNSTTENGLTTGTNTEIVNTTTENVLTTKAAKEIANSTTENNLVTEANTEIINSTTENTFFTTKLVKSFTEPELKIGTTEMVLTTTETENFSNIEIYTEQIPEASTSTEEPETITSIVTETSTTAWEKSTETLSTTTEIYNETTYLSDSTTEMVPTTDEVLNHTTENLVRTSKAMKDFTTTVETTTIDSTTVVPATNFPKVRKVSVPDLESDNVTTIETNTVTSDFYEHGTPEEDNSGTIAAIVISSIGAVCLVLLAGLLVIMRKRQKRFNYGQRCRPVSLDDYSMDNVSVQNSVRRKGAARASKRSYGNPAFEDPASITHTLNFPALSKFCNSLEEIRAEFEEIPQITARTNELPEGCDTKNRYANVIPLPESRVFLSLLESCPNSDYINANYVTGPKNTKGYYIACQAPMQNTVDDFWRMVWEQESRVILMLTHLFENGIEKCVDYLPPSEVLDCHRLFGDYQITLKKREVKDKYIISNLQLKNMVSNSWREITHFWYLGWPEKGVPSEANSLIAYLIEARSYMKASSIDRKENLTNGQFKNELNPVVVHCSPGTGRTGVVIACDIAIREFEQTRLVDVPRIVYKIRRNRANAVQTKEQYGFIYKVVSLYATKLTGGALDSF